MDLLNQFYSEFVKYSNTDGKSLGIVLTPDHIVKLMVKLLNIKSNDIVLDLCTGTGSFILEALKYKPLKVIGCEYQNKLYTLLKCNMIIRNIPENKYEIILNDCFNEEFRCTKSIINPPYSMKDKKELEFILKQ
ncbi:MAG: N-6 DNA methylase [Rheinheimera sp.]|nr:N-6 DNA methylase [Rheinheimera sp.]